VKAEPEGPISKAKVAADSERWGEAHFWLNEAEAQNCLDLPVQFLRALVLQGEERIPDAIHTLRRCLYLDHNFVMGYFTLGNLHARHGERDHAEQSWNNALELLHDLPPQAELPLSDGLTAEDLLILIQSQNTGTPT
jgi:chemotaxis protein methyltransferase CheR